ncbi:MAG: thioredoxin family protein [Erysipelotrichaceae bacterium]|nr:thioredoxin family protein [Erysipelotrichaceae bacterium]
MLTLFYLKSCPYCKEALRYLNQHRADYPNVSIQMIEESEQPEIASEYDYYYVPAFFIGKEKLHEGAVREEDIKEVLVQASKHA